MSHGSAASYASARRLLTIAAPIIATYLAEMAMGLTDVLMVSQLGSLELAAVGLAAAVYFTAAFVATNVLSIVGVLASDAHARGDEPRIGAAVIHGLGFALVLGGLLFGFARLQPALLLWSGQDPRVVAIAASYLDAISWASLPIVCFTVMRLYVSSVSTTQIVLLINACAIALNAVLDYGLVFGRLGLPMMGVAGPAYATALVNVLMCVAIVAYIWYRKLPGREHIFALRSVKAYALIRQLLRLGIPAGGLAVVEGGMFAAVSVLAGRFGADFLAANQIALSMSDIGIALAFGLGEAATICVAHVHATRDAALTRRAGYTALWCGVALMSAYGAVLMLGHRQIARLFLSDSDPAAAAVLPSAATLLIIVALFQIADGTQAVLSRTLRGMHDTVYAMWISVIAYWVVGILGGWLLATSTSIAGHGLWIGMAVGLFCGAMLLARRFARLCRAMANGVGGVSPASEPLFSQT